jgi:hypothetical protein
VVTATVDDVYYEAVRPSGLSERLFVAARDRIFRDFMDRMRPTAQSQTLDVGVSDVISDDANVLERRYPQSGANYGLRIRRRQRVSQRLSRVRYEQIQPMTRKQLWRLAGSLDRSVAVGYTGLLLGRLSSNLCLAIR